MSCTFNVHVLMRVTGRVDCFGACVPFRLFKIKYSVFYVDLHSCIILCIILLVSFMQS